MPGDDVGLAVNGAEVLERLSLAHDGGIRAVQRDAAAEGQPGRGQRRGQTHIRSRVGHPGRKVRPVVGLLVDVGIAFGVADAADRRGIGGVAHDDPRAVVVDRDGLSEQFAGFAVGGGGGIAADGGLGQRGRRGHRIRPPGARLGEDEGCAFPGVFGGRARGAAAGGGVSAGRADDQQVAVAVQGDALAQLHAVHAVVGGAIAHVERGGDGHLPRR